MSLFDTTWYVNYGNGSTTGYYAVPVWPGALTPVTAGTWCRQLTTPAVGSERCFVCIVAGSTGAAEPVWVVTRGADTGADIDGTVTWQECTGMAGPCGDLTNCPAWVASTTYTLGSVIYDSSSVSYQIKSKGSTAGGSSRPGFSATAGTVVNDTTTANQWTSLGPTSNYTTAFKYPHARLANAFTATWGVAGNQFAVSSIHAETQATAITLTNPGTAASPCPVYCITNTTTLASPALNTTASISATGAVNLGTNGFGYFYGITFIAGSGSNAGKIFLGVSAVSVQYFDNCVFNLNTTATTSTIATGDSSNAVSRYLDLRNCTFIFGSASQQILMGGCHVLMAAATIAATGTVPTTLILGGSGTTNGGSDLTIRDTDLSNITSNIISAAGTGPNNFYFQNCKLANAVTLVTGSYGDLSGTFVRMHNCDSTSANYRYYFGNYTATVTQETTIVRTGSLATDGTTPISWNITTTANSKYLQPFVSDEISIWNDTTGSTVTITLYLISNTTLNNNDFWAEVEYAGTSSFPLGLTVNSRMTPLGTPAALTSDTSTWGGSTNKYKIVLTCTPQNKGPIKVRFYAAKASATTYVDPFIYLTDSNGNLKSSGRSFFIPGWGYSSESAPSFMARNLTGGING